MDAFRKKVIAAIVFWALIAVLGFGAYFYYSDKDSFKKAKEWLGNIFKQEKQDSGVLPKEEKELTLIQSITPIIPDQQKTFTEEEKKLIESISPLNETKTPIKTSDQETQKLLESITPNLINN